jgi:vancomycin resistance protein YoaR
VLRPTAPAARQYKAVAHALDAFDQPRRRWRWWWSYLRLAILALPIAAVSLAVAGYLLNARAHRDRVASGVTLAGRDISGLTQPQLDGAVDSLGVQLATSRIQVNANSGGLATTSAAIRLHLDSPLTARRAMQTGRSGWPGARWWSWLRSLVHPIEVTPVVGMDRGAVESVVTANDRGRVSPAEPQVVGTVAGFTVIAGRPGNGIDPAAVMAALPAAVKRGTDPIVVQVTRGPISPRFTYEDASRVASKAAIQVREPLPVTAGEAAAEIPLTTLRSWVRSRAGPSGLELLVDPAATLAYVAKLLPNAGPGPSDTQFTVSGNVVSVATPGAPGQVCCADNTPAVIDKALFGGALPTPTDPALALPVRLIPTRLPADLVAKLGISQPIGTFTTAYDPAQPRVTNIQRIADLIRGWVILPGETFSLNDVAGPRTPERGFIPAQSIGSGHHYTTDVGGGISQFASTLFNAAYVGGLGIVEHRSSSIYDPHEPFGRDATVSFPSPDLRLANTGPYGVLIWTSYTDTSITVTLYSTNYATGQQTGQTLTPSGRCQRVRTRRTVTYAGGHTTFDDIDAFYYPGDGLPC